MQQRIDRLESIVQTLMAQGQEVLHLENATLPINETRSPSYPRSGLDKTIGTNDASSALYNAGTTVVNEGHSVYSATNDWSDVLQEVRAYFFNFQCNGQRHCSAHFI